MAIRSRYFGFTYSKIFDNRLSRWLCRKFFCKHHIHLFDEVWTGKDHYLCCDACQIMVYIDCVDEQYVAKEKNNV